MHVLPAMKKGCVFVALMAVIQMAAQDTPNGMNVKFGPVLHSKETALDGMIDLLSHDEGGYLVLSSDKNFFYFDKLDNDLVSVTTRSLPKVRFHEKELILKAHYSNGRELLLLFQCEDRKEDKVYLLAQRVNLQELNYSGELEILEENSYEKRRYISGYQTCVSQGGSKFLVFTSSPGENGTPEKYSFRVFGDGLTELWQKDVELPYPNERFQSLDVVVDEGGSVFLTCKYYERTWKEAKKNDLVPYTYHILGIFDKGSVIKDFEVLLGNKYVHTMGCGLDVNGDILATGAYSNTAETGAKGIFFIRIDRSTKQVVKQSTRELDFDFITGSLSEKSKAKLQKKEQKAEDYGIPNLVLRQIVMHDDGSISMVGEVFYTYVACTVDSRGSRSCITYYVYGDIIVIKADREGELQWTKRIEKFQRTGDGPYFSSYIMLPQAGDLVFLYNDNPKNYITTRPGNEPPKARYTYTFKAISTYMAEINDEGMIRQGELFRHEKNSPFFIPKLSSVKDGEFFLYLRRGKRIQFCSVEPKNS